MIKSFTVEQIIRNIKLYILSGIKLDKHIDSLYNDIQNSYGNLNEYRLEDSNDIVFRDCNNEVVAQYRYIGNYIWIDSNLIVSIYHNNNCIFSFYDIRNAITWYINDEYNINL